MYLVNCDIVTHSCNIPKGSLLPEGMVLISEHYCRITIPINQKYAKFLNPNLNYIGSFLEVPVMPKSITKIKKTRLTNILFGKK